MSLVRFPIVVGLTAACFCVGDAGSAEPSRTRPVAALGDTGLAAAYSADRGIASHPSVIFAEDFESTDYQRRWDEARDKNRDVLSLVRLDGDKDPFGRSLKVRAVLGRNTGGGLTKWFQSADTLYVRFYSYWHEMTASPDGKYWGNSFKPEAQSNIRKDRWICAEFMLKHNTPGKADGEQAIWIDGKSMGHWGGINWRKTPGLKVNALTLESYVTDHWTRNPTNIVYFDNLVIAREYIGPMKQRDEVKEPVRK
jgi:hypothetical protein